MHLYLVRHGQSFVDVGDWGCDGGQAVGQPWTVLGQQEARAFAA